MRLPPHEAQDRVYRALADAATAGQRAPAVPALAKIAGCSVRALMAAIKALQRDGKIERRGSPQCRTYFIAATGLETARSEWRRPALAGLGPVAQAVLAMLSAAAAAGEPTPHRRDMMAMLARQGMAPTKSGLCAALKGLERGGAVAVSGRVYSRVYRILATGQSTTEIPRMPPPVRARPKQEAAAPEMDAPPLPPPPPPPSASYDAAVARREFARHEMRPDPQPIRVIRAPYGNRSLTGSAAGMCPA